MRRLGYAFLALPEASRAAIARELGLTREDERELPDGVARARWWQRARATRQLAALEVAVERHQAHGAALPAT